LSVEQELTIGDESWIGSLANIGALVGTIISWFLTKFMSVRHGLLVASFGTILGWALLFISAQTEYLGLLKIGLVILGLSCGLSNPMSSIYITEIAGQGNKGMVSSMQCFNLTFGILLTNVIGSLTGWYLTSITLGAMNIAITGSLFFLVISPYELGRKGRAAEIPRILSKLRRKTVQEVEDETQSIIQDLRKVNKEEKVLDKMKRIDGKNLLIVLVVFSMTQFSGINVLTSYMVDIFSSIQIGEFTLVLITGLAEMFFSFLQMIIADKLGRKTFLLSSLFGCGVTTLVFAAIFWKSQQEEKVLDETIEAILGNSAFHIMTLIIYFFAYNIGLGPVKYILISELFPPEDMKLMAGACHTWYWVATFVCNKMFFYLVDSYGLANIFLSISVLMAINFLFTCLAVPETRKKKEKSNKSFCNGGYQGEKKISET